MYRYRLIDKTLIGRCYYYTLEDLCTRDEIMLPLSEIVHMLENNEISNAIPRGEKHRPFFIPDVIENLEDLKRTLGNNNELIVYLRGKTKLGYRWYFYIRVFDHKYSDISELVWRTVSRFHTLTKTQEIAVKSKKDPVMSLIREINLEAKNCGMEPFVSKTFHYRKRLGTGRGMGTKIVNRSLEEAGVCDFYVHALNTGKYGFYYLENLIQHGDEPEDIFRWLMSLSAINSDIDREKVELAIKIFKSRMG